MAKLIQAKSPNLVPQSTAHLGSMLLRIMTTNMMFAYRLDPDIVDLLPSSDEVVGYTPIEKLKHFDKVVKGLSPLREERAAYLNSLVKDCELCVDYLLLEESQDFTDVPDINERYKKSIDKQIKIQKSALSELEDVYKTLPEKHSEEDTLEIQEKRKSIEEAIIMVIG